MNTKTSHKIIAAGGMAAVIAIGVAVFFMRSPPVAPVARVDVPTAPVADTPAAAPEAIAEPAVAPSPVADVPAAPAPSASAALSDTASHKGSERAVPPLANTKPARHPESATASNQVDTSSSHTIARSESVVTTTDKPVVVAERVDAVAGSDSASMTASAPAASPDTGTSEKLVASDSQITTEVKSAIANEGLTKDASIAVTTTDGVVALSGSVPSQAAIEQVKDVAAKVKDVKRVDISGLLLASL